MGLKRNVTKTKEIPISKKNSDLKKGEVRDNKKNFIHFPSLACWFLHLALLSSLHLALLVASIFWDEAFRFGLILPISPQIKNTDFGFCFRMPIMILITTYKRRRWPTTTTKESCNDVFCRFRCRRGIRDWCHSWRRVTIMVLVLVWFMKTFQIYVSQIQDQFGNKCVRALVFLLLKINLKRESEVKCKVICLN